MLEFDQHSVLEFLLFELVDIDLGSGHGHDEGLGKGLVGVFLVKLDIINANQVVFAKDEIVWLRIGVQVAVVSNTLLDLVFGTHEGGGFPVGCPVFFALGKKEFREGAHQNLIKLLLSKKIA